MNRRYGEKFLKKVVSIVEHNEKFFAILGKADGTVKADDYSRVYVRDWSGKVSIVYNDVVPLEPGRLVNVWRNKRTKRMEIIGFANLYPTERQIELPYHAVSHQWPNGDTLFVRPEQFMGGGLVVPVIGELEIEIVGYYYKLGQSFYFLENKEGDNAIDLSGELPVTGAEWVNIEVDENGDISFNHGTNKDSPYLLTLQDIPTTTTDKRLICSVKLYDSQTEINKNKSEIFDPRFTGDGTGGIADEVEWDNVQNKPTEFNPDLDVTDPRYPRIYTFASAPTENDDNTEGYKIGDLWIDTSSLIAYRAVDVSTGAAVWISGNGSGGAIIFHVEGALAVVDDASISFIITGGTSITNWYFMLENTGSSGSTILDIILNGTTSIFQDDYTDNRPIITYDDADGLVKVVAIITDFVENDILTVNIDQIASGASDLSIMSEGISGNGNNFNLILEDESAIVSVSNVGKIVVPDGSLSNNGGGEVSIIHTPYICIQDQKAQGTSGGTFTSGAWRTRDLNTEVSDVGGFASVSSNQITLAAGTYIFDISAPAYKCNRHQAKLYNVSDASDVAFGSSEYTGSADNTGNRSVIRGKFTIAASKILEVRHQCQTTSNTYGLGVEANFGTEIYTIAEFWKVG